MKRLLLMTLVVCLPLALMAQDDDLYFTPKKKNQTTTTTSSYQGSYNSRTSSWNNPSVEVYNTNARSDDEYNRRFSNYGGAYQTGEVTTRILFLLPSKLWKEKTPRSVMKTTTIAVAYSVSVVPV